MCGEGWRGLLADLQGWTMPILGHPRGDGSRSLVTVRDAAHTENAEKRDERSENQDLRDD